MLVGWVVQSAGLIVGTFQCFLIFLSCWVDIEKVIFVASLLARAMIGTCLSAAKAPTHAQQLGASGDVQASLDDFWRVTDKFTRQTLAWPM